MGLLGLLKITSFWRVLVLQDKLKSYAFLKPRVVLRPCLFEKALYTDIIFRKIENRELATPDEESYFKEYCSIIQKRALKYKAVVNMFMCGLGLFLPLC